ncbi:MAG: gas vesicle protein GvpJ [Phycisphaerae bacterium]
MSTTAASGQPALRDEQHVSLCETLDRVLNKGVVVVGEVVISVADVDLIYLGLQLVLTSVETMRGRGSEVQPGVGTRERRT